MKIKNIIIMSSLILAGAEGMAYAEPYLFVCQSCPAGTYSDGTLEECAKCPAGKYSQGNAVECSTCLAGTYSTGGASGCTNCSPNSSRPNASKNCGDETVTWNTYCENKGETSNKAYQHSYTYHHGNNSGVGQYCNNGIITNCNVNKPSCSYYTTAGSCSWSCDCGSTYMNGQCCSKATRDVSYYVEEDHCICGSISSATEDKGATRNGSCSWTGYGGSYSGCDIKKVTVKRTKKETYWRCDYSYVCQCNAK